ncbi:AbrB/MazE/SpoVT family DNA-binding domain-containing protein [Butyricicoccus faecihominis]|uniref:AbrB/MazE/SpoVT family DNA-binding domain-containing protein n=1 Tax=Butyricicoccaceae TaxID=3085642 RepID=UPI002479374C|nr:AbrB/MazE/SpoVT family DNA-binding domain-containing protein [Agathobaculum sp. NTUH-O15-33]MCQ5129999.1 AbrB/MazE/SpoVT family DNA-binding domain-containing protein [Butyricicoccus faecihominis]WNX86674.1 AbrB/MazE/SpoVT family DNA-binding domain-containing protein [Agathobaculum sp. NTUH-O15-33]
MKQHGKHIFGTVKVGEKGQIVIPKKARDLFGIHPGDLLLVLGDEAQGGGLAMIKSEAIMGFAQAIMEAASDPKEAEQEE